MVTILNKMLMHFAKIIIYSNVFITVIIAIIINVVNVTIFIVIR